MRTVILGMNNPYSERPEFALYPYPPRSAGARLFRLLLRRVPDVTRAEYLRAFERRNLVEGREWDKRAAKNAARVTRLQLRGRKVVVLGREVSAALGLVPLLIEPVRLDGAVYRQLPHPSGRNHFYNDPDAADVAAMVLEDALIEWRLSC